MMKKLISLLLSVMFVVVFFGLCTACGGDNGDQSTTYSITLSSATVELKVGEETELTLLGSGFGPSDAEWKSDNVAVATVSNGTVTATGVGQTKVTATVTVNGKTYSDSCTVTVPEYVTVTFKTEDGKEFLRYVKYGEALTDLPAVPKKDGLTGVWEITSFPSVTSPITVNAVYSNDKFTVTFKESGNTVEKMENLAVGAKVTAPTAVPTKAGNATVKYCFDGWFDKKTNKKWDFESDTVSTNHVLEARFFEYQAVLPSFANKEIDLYFIAGQSNAAGYSKWDTQNTMTDTVLKYGTNYVLYAGNAQSTGDWTNYTATKREFYWSRAVMGMGREEGYFGAEAGMAKKLGEYYNQSSGKTAGIIKCAQGGTSLLNNLGGENRCAGNWVSPSYAATLSDVDSKLTGGMYRMFLEYAQKHVEQLKSLGCTKLNFKGLYWMQGESDVGRETEYKKAFKCFAADIRKDLGEIAGVDLSAMPIYVGEISATEGGVSQESRNRTFIAMQNELADEVNNVTVIHSAEYPICDANGPISYDEWHWPEASMLEIGRLLGEAILNTLQAA